MVMVKKGLMIGGLIILILLFLIYGIDDERQRGDTETEEEVLSQNAETPPIVQTYPVEKRDLAYTLTYHGRIAPKSQVAITPKIPGIVEEVFCRVGDRVKKGDPIFQLETEELVLQVRQAQASLKAAEANQDRILAGARMEEIEQAEAALRQAQANFNQAQMNYERSKKLFQENVISASEWEVIEVQLEGAKAQLVNAEKTLAMIEQGAREEDILAARASVTQAQVAHDLAQLNLKNATITSPIHGTISRLLAEEGSMAGTGMAVASVVHIATVKLPLQATGRDIVHLREGQKTTITLDALPDQVFEGRVTTISPAADEGGGLFSFTVEMDNKENILRPGMYATAEIHIIERANVLTVPLRALSMRDEEDKVFLVDQGTIRRVPVERGVEREGYIEIQGDLHVGDLVVVSEHELLEEGMQVQVTEWSDHP